MTLPAFSMSTIPLCRRAGHYRVGTAVDHDRPSGQEDPDRPPEIRSVIL